VDDHSKMLDETKQLADSKGVKLPTAPARKQQAAMKKLQSAEGEEFDRAFMAQMVKDHGEALQLAQKTSRQAKDPELKAAAGKAAPEIQDHLQMARKISGETGAKSK
jgi:putative membrane protein